MITLTFYDFETEVVIDEWYDVPFMPQVPNSLIKIKDKTYEIVEIVFSRSKPLGQYIYHAKILLAELT